MILPEPAETPEVLEEEIIRLLGERLVVDRGKRKIVWGNCPQRNWN